MYFISFSPSLDVNYSSDKDSVNALNGCVCVFVCLNLHDTLETDSKGTVQSFGLSDGWNCFLTQITYIDSTSLLLSCEISILKRSLKWVKQSFGRETIMEGKATNQSPYLSFFF